MKRHSQFLRFALLLVPTILLAGCLSSKPPKAKYYKEAAFEGVGGWNRTVAFDLHIGVVPRAPTKVAGQLPERALAALIEAYSTDEKMITQIPSLLAAPIKRSRASASFDYSLVKFKKRFTFTIVPRGFHPADRLYSATLTAKAPGGWRFTGWTGFKPKDRTINYAKVETELSQKQNASIKLAPPQIKELAEASLSNERQRTDSVEQDLAFEVIEFLPRLDDQTAELTLNAPFPQINVAGSYSVDIDFEFNQPEVQRFVEFAFEKGEVTNYVLRALRFVPNLSQGNLGDLIPAQSLEDVSLSYVERIVFDSTSTSPETGASTADEGDDIATYRVVRDVRNAGQANKRSDQQPPGAPKGTILLRSEEVKAVVVLALFEGEPVFFYDAHAHQAPSRAQCLVLRNGSQAQEFSAWVTRGSTPRVAGKRKDGRRWKLMIDRDGQRRELQSSDLEGKVPPFVFEAVVLNNPKQAKELSQRCKPRN